MPVVALNPRNDADMILRCLRKGACEFLAHPSAEAVRGLFERLARARSPQPARPIGAVYCLVPGKAGCGASTLAAHLAVQFASSGARTLLLDADFVTGSIGFMLKLKSDFHLGDVLTDWKRMDDDLWKRLTARCCGVDVVLAPGNPATRVELDKVRAGELAGFWRDRYDAIVIDTPDVRMAAESGLAGLADHILLVTTNELGALHGARRGIEYLDQALPDRGRIRLIVNRYVPALGLKREDLRTALRMEPFAILSNDYESMQAALLEGKPAHSQSRFSNSMLALAKRLRGEPSVEKKQSPWSSFAGLLSRPK
jgi:pilus assembly protein CpaE